MEKDRMYKVLLVSAGVFGCGAVVLNSWTAAVMAIGALVASEVEMFMRRVLFEERVMDLAVDLRNTAKELNGELTKVKNDIIRLNNKNGLR
jgi:hypothetical protein